MQAFTRKFRELPFKNYAYFAFLISLFTLALIFALRDNLPPEVPLYFGKPTGPAQLTTPLGLTVAPLLALAILTVNSFIATFLTDVFLKKILLAAALITSLLAAITVIKIIFLVGFF